jgi:Holliday junction resolvase
MKAKQKGYRTERKAAEILRRSDFYVVRSGGSLGPFDLVALRRDAILLVQCKTNRGASLEELERIREYARALPNACCEVWLFRDYAGEPQRIRV